MLSEVFIRNLARVMNEKGMSQSALANSSGVSQGMISLVMSSRREPTLSVVDKIARALEVDPSELLSSPRLNMLPLNESEKAYESLNETPVWAIRKDGEGRILWICDSLCEYFKINKKEAIGQMIRDLDVDYKILTESDHDLEEREDYEVVKNNKLACTVHPLGDKGDPILIVKFPIDGGSMAIGVPFDGDKSAIVEELQNDLMNMLSLTEKLK